MSKYFKNLFSVEPFLPNLTQLEDEDDNSILSLSKKNYEFSSLNDSYSLSNENSDTNDISKGGELKFEDMRNIFQNTILDRSDDKIKEIDIMNPLFSLSKSSLFNIQEEKSFLKKKRFKINTRGRKPKGNKVERRHNSITFDNLQSKIQVHFFSFIIDISNDALVAYFGRNNTFNFKDITYEKKKIIKFESCDGYKNSCIKDILSNEISPKYKKFPKNNNENTLNEVCKIPWLNEFFSMNYMDFFKKYYYKEKPLKEIPFNKKIITLSKKTKTFYDLLIKYKKDEIELKEAVRRIYFNGYNKIIGKDSFIVKK
jgi:hypothetical protein